MLISWRGRVWVAAVLGAVAANGAGAQAVGSAGAPRMTGTFKAAGCGLESAAVAPDSLHVQIECQGGPPSSHIAFVDARLEVRDGRAEYVRAGHEGSCRITISFRRTRAIVTEKGTDLACGFGEGMSVDGTYSRTGSKSPAFDLNPCPHCTAGAVSHRTGFSL